MWQRVVAFTVVGSAVLIVAGILHGASSWQSDTSELRGRLEAARFPASVGIYDPGELDPLPEPVQRYFRIVLTEGQRVVAAISVEHTGSLNMSEVGEQWKPFESTQRVTIRRPGFVWDARILVAPGMTVHVRDAYVAGEGVLTARLFGLVSAMEQPSTPELAQGELMRFLAEGAWYPTALLPSQGVVWRAIDETRAGATLTDGTVTADMVFQFDAQGLISSVRSDVRYREVGGVQVATPWQGRFWDYELRDGMLVPLQGEAAWLCPDGLKPYWLGHVSVIRYEFAK